MRQRLAVCVAIVLAGCTRAREARTGREFLDQLRIVVKAGNSEAVWGMLTRGSREVCTEQYRDWREKAKTDAASREALRADAGLEGDPTAVPPEELARRAIARSFAGKQIPDARFLEEREESGRVILALATREGNREEWVLVREGAVLRLDLPATWQRPRKTSQ